MNLQKSFRLFMTILLSIAMIFATMPLTAFAEGDAVCKHQHDETCGYIEGVDCDHVHGESCGEDGADCVHVCDDETCAYTEDAPCTHEHDADCGGLGDATGQIAAPVVIIGFDPYPYTHPDYPGLHNIEASMGTSQEALPLPMTLYATAEGGEENAYTVEVASWTCAEKVSYTGETSPGSYDPQTSGIYRFTPVLALKENESLKDGVIPPTADVAVIMGFAAAAVPATIDTLVNIIKNFGAGTGGLQAVKGTGLGGTPTVTVTGQMTDCWAALNLDIPTGVKVVWKASIERKSQGNLFDPPTVIEVISITGDGTFEVADGGRIINHGSTIRNYPSLLRGDYAIFAENSNVTVTGGWVSSEGIDGRAIHMRRANSTVEVRGGTVESSWSGSAAINVHTNAVNARVNVYGGTVRTVGVDGAAILAGSENCAVEVTNSTVEATADSGKAIHAEGENSTVMVGSGGTVEAKGKDGTAILATGKDSGVTVNLYGTVKATGQDGAAILAKGSYSAVTVSGGTVEATQTDGKAIFVSGYNSAAIVEGGTVKAKTVGRAIFAAADTPYYTGGGSIYILSGAGKNITADGNETGSIRRQQSNAAAYYIGSKSGLFDSSFENGVSLFALDAVSVTANGVAHDGNSSTPFKVVAQLSNKLDLTGATITVNPDSKGNTGSPVQDKAANTLTFNANTGGKITPSITVRNAEITGTGFRINPFSTAAFGVNINKVLDGLVVGVNGTAKVGETLTVNLSALTPLGNGGAPPVLNYQWQSSAAENGPYTDISGATGASYTVELACLKKYVRVKIGADGYTGNLYSNSVLIDKANISGSVSINIEKEPSLDPSFPYVAQKGDVLSVDLDGIIPASAKSGVTCSWDVNGTPVIGDTYTVTESDVLSNNIITVTANASGDYTGSLRASVQAGRTIVTISGLSIGDSVYTAGIPHPVYIGNAVFSTKSGGAPVTPSVPTLTALYTGADNGGASYKSATPPTNAGSYAVTVMLANDALYCGAWTSTFTIRKATPIFTPPNGLTATYGQTLADVSLPTGFSWNDPSTSVGGVGRNTFPATYTQNNDADNYSTIPNVQITVVVGRKTITFAPVAPLTKDYDGNNLAIAGAVTFTGEITGQTLAPNTDYTATAEFADSNAGANKEYTYTVTLLNTQKANNYNLAQPTIPRLDGVIRKIDYPGTKNANINVSSNTAETGVTVILPALPEEAVYGAPAVTAAGLVTNASLDSFSGTVTLTFNVTSQTDGTQDKITIPVTGAKNYNDYDVVVTVEAQDAVQEGTPVASINFINERIAGLYAYAVYKIAGEVKFADANGDISIESAWIGTTVSIIKNGVAPNIDSAPQDLLIPARPVVPSPGKTNTTGGSSNGSITGVDSTMEYKPSSASTWTAITGVSVTGLSAGTYNVRYKAGIANFASVSCDVTIDGSSGSSGSGGGTGGGGSSGGTDTGGDTSVTIPATTNGDNEVRDIPATIDGKTGNVALGLTLAETDELIAAAQKANSPTVTFDLSNVPGAKTATIPMAAAQRPLETGLSVTVKLPVADVTLDIVSLRALSKVSPIESAVVSIEVTTVPMSELTGEQAAQVKGYETVINADIFVDGKKVDIPVTISMPYTLKAGEDPKGVVAWHLADDGTLTKLAGVYDETTGMITFNTAHQSYFVVGYDAVELWVNIFSDVSEDAWYYEAVAFVNQNGLFGGYGNGIFGPNDAMTRGMFVTVLYKMNGSPDVSKLSNPFSDVPDTWYTDAVNWAYHNGIVSGVGGGKYAPDNAITRQEMAVMLYNYAILMGYDFPQNRAPLPFADAGRIDMLAETAVAKLTESGVIDGVGENNYAPQKTATRAEVAALLQKFLRVFVL